MKIAIFLSTLGGSPLQGGMERGLSELGHTVEDYRPGHGYDLIILFNQTAHVIDYDYLQFPPPNIPVAFIDSAEYGWQCRLPNQIANYWNGFAEGSINHDTKNRWQQVRLRQFLEGRSFPYFLREFSHYYDFPENYHPIDYPLYYRSVCNEPPNREEYLRRDLDLFCSWGASHPWRVNITDELRKAHVKSEIGIIEQEGHERIPQDFYFGRMRAAKCCPSFDGYGSGSFRITEALVRTVLLNGPLTIRTHMPLVDGVTCVEYQVESKGTKYLSTNIAEKMRGLLADPEGSFEIYQNGYYHCNQYYTERATAEYLLAVVHNHDWSKPTKLTT